MEQVPLTGSQLIQNFGDREDNQSAWIDFQQLLSQFVFHPTIPVPKIR